MAQFSIDQIVEESLDNAWKAYINPNNMVKWTKFLEKVEIVKGKFGEVGAIAHLHYIEKGRQYVLEDKLLEYEEGKRILSQVSGQGMIVKVETRFSEHPNGTLISMDWNGTSKSILIRFLLRLIKSKITKHAKAELVAFKELLESHGTIFP